MSPYPTGAKPVQNCAARISRFMVSPIHDPTTPGWDVKATSDTLWPLYFHAARNRMWHAQMDAHVMTDDRPEMASIQLNACVRVSSPAAMMRHSSPTADAKMMAIGGRQAH
ncbi:uncharacterized protein A1O5_01085 [Cladophialophora psammophila CBS 110553]|uniref:Uncharacterized protein n=1 Tax=Cladophialophora psammophila CBS 110553 TaxID=1182543 RepID=W9X7X2_9EURO|nr:uncharacterized protein A1O5_01085 [Cladophialophora psammophila CBS 110553]EXJ76577.1 hypothetical protein A1O5_01085 [Cladophialophora psammophila CBS 110553]